MVRHAAFALSFLFALCARASEPEVCADESAVRVIPLPSALVRRIDQCANAQKMQIHAHRGSGKLPENSISAFREAIREGADTIELDLQISADPERTVLVAHDANTKPTRCFIPGGPEGIATLRSLSLAEIKKFDCGSRPQAGAVPVPGEKIPTLSEALELLKHNKATRFNIEIKYENPKYYPPLEEYVEAVIKTVEEAEKNGVSSEQFFFQSFNHEALAILKKKKPEWEISPLVGGEAEGQALLRKAPYALGAKLVTPHYSAVTPEILAKLRADGIKVVTWTANTRPEMLKLIDMGVDGIITDQVPLFLEIKKELCGQ